MENSTSPVQVTSPVATCKSQQEQLHLLDTHPMFTGKCPQCGEAIERDYRAVVHWDCECGWMDDSV